MLDQIERLAAPAALFDACHRRDQRGVMDLLLEGHRVDTPNSHGQTMLMIASCMGDLAMVELLLSQGADVRARDAYGRACLHHATGGGSQAMIRLLVSSGAIINHRTERGYTPLHFACRSTDIDAIEALISLKADVHAVTSKGDTAIHQAVRSIEYSNWMVRMLQVVERLVIAGIDPMIFNSEGKTGPDLIEHWLSVFADDRQRVRVLIDARQRFKTLSGTSLLTA